MRSRSSGAPLALLAAAAAFAFAFALAAAPVPAAAAPIPYFPRVEIGIADQKPDMFVDERFLGLGIRHARLAVSWDWRYSDWQVDQLDAWLRAARDAGVEPLVSFMHSRRNRRKLPTPERLQREFRELLDRYPWVDTFATWNEANHCGQPTCHRAKLVAAYYRAMRRACRSCKILAAELLDMPNAVKWARELRRHLRFTPRLWGLHNYVEANRFRMRRLRQLQRALPGASLWLTETGGLVARDNDSKTKIPEGPRHAGEVTRYIFDRIVPANPRIQRVYLYHWNAERDARTWDSGLITPGGRERSAMLVLERVLRFGLRPEMGFRSARANARPVSGR